MIPETTLAKMQAICDRARGFVEPEGIALLQELIDEARSEQDPIKCIVAGLAVLELAKCLEAVAHLKADDEATGGTS